MVCQAGAADSSRAEMRGKGGKQRRGKAEVVGEERYSSQRVTRAMRTRKIGRCWAQGEDAALLSATNKPFPRVTESHSTGGTRAHGFPLKRTKALPFRGTPHGLAWHFPQCVPLGANRCSVRNKKTNRKGFVVK